MILFRNISRKDCTPFATERLIREKDANIIWRRLQINKELRYIFYLTLELSVFNGNCYKIAINAPSSFVKLTIAYKNHTIK